MFLFEDPSFYQQRSNQRYRQRRQQSIMKIHIIQDITRRKMKKISTNCTWQQQYQQYQQQFNQQQQRQKQQQVNFTPKYKINEIDGVVVISMEIPGFKKEDINIAVQDLTLILSGTKSPAEEIEDQEIDFINSTSSPIPSTRKPTVKKQPLVTPKKIESFSQSFELSKNLDLHSITAKHQDDDGDNDQDQDQV
ncbi:hypothetical protein PPL_06628 [Heterostelium album PN500]|uniref:SHSP domain-containing protein n=1 Tax=Heterostelium pallidum (strain ATCC 26659 / Pp 5 / PN500) TaxID=670386 RepID=D3BF95_HETP5|nr:hypothetical protein PPL_06628 [Heterostelium album PN500]EFA79809.1 hypothetical protein PPL_06628 [Heterostelium album PN500]|eukprot:XP_020431930.1 hypothetical protein PPL_06628 [Heterostelium album PN500]